MTLRDAIHEVVLLRCEDHPALLPVVAAARRVAEAPEVWWCETHSHSSGRRDHCPYAFAVQTTPCRMVRKLLVDPPEGNHAAGS